MKKWTGLALGCLLASLGAPGVLGQSLPPSPSASPNVQPSAQPFPAPVESVPPPAEPAPSPTPDSPAVPSAPAEPVAPEEVPPSNAPPARTPGRPKSSAKVTLLRSLPTLTLGGWRAGWELHSSKLALQALGLPVTVIDPVSLRRKGCPTTVLILENVKNMDKATVLAIKQHLREGGKVLATYQTSYRQEDNRSWTPNNFALSTELGVRFSRWVGGSNECGRLFPRGGVAPTETDKSKTMDTAGPSDGAVRSGIMLLRHQAMLVDVLPGARVLATWDRPYVIHSKLSKTTRASEPAAAVVEGPGGIYCGEDLLAPENAQSPEILRLLSIYLTELDPQLHPQLPDPAKFQLPPPNPPVAQLPPLTSEASIRVGLGSFDLAGQLHIHAHQGPLRLRTGSISRLCHEISVRDEGGKMTLEAVLESKPPYKSIEITPTAAVQLYPTLKTTYLDVVWESPDATGRWEGYRGELDLTGGLGSVSMINVLPLDAYLLGVVPSEVPQTFPEEALKAMAVVARSFSLSHLERHKSEGFDVCSEVHCQVYRGLAQEAPSSNEAVLGTLGEVLSYQGKTADATFHACCGGYGVDVETAWPHYGSLAYLKGKPDFDQVLDTDLGNARDLRTWLSTPSDAYCSGAGRFRWDEKMRWGELESKLDQSLPQLVGKDYKGLGALKEIKVTVRDVSGRVARLLIEGEKGSYTVGGDATRWITSGGRVGTGGLNSSLFVIDIEGKGAERIVHFRGAGWGHGVGLCQEGAAGRAKAGQSYSEILAHYYGGTDIVKDPAPAPEAILPAVPQAVHDK